MTNPFMSEQENQICSVFQQQGYYQFKVLNLAILVKLKSFVFQLAKELLSLQDVKEDHFFDFTHEYVSREDLNDFRVQLIKRLNENQDLKLWLFRLGDDYIRCLVGNELAMQRSANLSIQLPSDDSSLLPIHTDVFSGNSPYEVVFWIPLVDCFQTKSMFLLPREQSDQVVSQIDRYAESSTEELYKTIEPDLEWLRISFGEAVLFSHTILHGNRVNEESTVRWTINFRYKSLLSPYGSKELGESFLPMMIRPVTEIGFQYPSTKETEHASV